MDTLDKSTNKSTQGARTLPDGYPQRPPATVSIEDSAAFLKLRGLVIVRSYWVGNQFMVEVAAPTPAANEEAEL